MDRSQENWKNRLIILATAIGAAAGFTTGYLLIRTAEESGGAAPKISTTDAIKTAVGVIGIMRGIAALGNRK